MRVTAALLLVPLLALGCARRTGEDGSEGLPRRFGVTPAPATAEPAPGSPDPEATPAAATPAPAPGAVGEPTPGVTRVPARVVGTVQDPPGDSGGPAHSDLVTVTFAEDSSTAVVTVEMAAGVPAKLTEGEVIGIGVDVYPSAEARESSHQLFADGNADGWRAYLQTPDGIVQYPGTFRLDGRRLVFTVPWPALGDPRRGFFTAFADLSRRSGAEQSRDDVPDSGRAAFTR